MSVSLPSAGVYSIDVPEVTSFAAKFVYNFFVPNESSDDTGGVPQRFLERPSDQVDAAFLQFASTRAPRYVVMTFRAPSHIMQPANLQPSLLPPHQQSTYISDNIGSIITEDEFTLGGFVAVGFHDANIDNRVFQLVSGSFVMRSLGSNVDTDVSHIKAATQLNRLTSNDVNEQFLTRALANPELASGVHFFDENGSEKNGNYFDSLKTVTTNVQINTKFLKDMIGRTIATPTSYNSAGLQELHDFAKNVSHSVHDKVTPTIGAEQHKTFVRYVAASSDPAYHSDYAGPKLVGYIIDKLELFTDGTSLAHPPLIINDPSLLTTADFRVRYGSTYVYAIRSVVELRVPAIDDDTGDSAMLTILVSSRPSNRVYVVTSEHIAPPAPTDLGFTWDYERINPTTAEHDPLSGEPFPNTGTRGSLLIHWSFPPNTQRDVKRFQVFRRRDTSHAFELIKEYDFNDGDVRFDDNESPDPVIVERITSPRTFFYDDEFLTSSRYVYAVCSIDAHGMTSGYSMQMDVWFDQFKNALQKKLVSHRGAPKQYPNLYLGADVFVDTIRSVGHTGHRMRLYFNPQYYSLYDDAGRVQDVVTTTQRGGRYKFSVINVDNQKTADINVTLDDRRAASAPATGQSPVLSRGGNK
jgi:hypothetical protein